MAFDTVVDKVKLESAITATANAIREKTGKTDLIPWDSTKGFSNAIVELKVNELINHGVIPNYVKQEVLRVINLVDSVRKPDSIVFPAMSDSHHCGPQDDTSWQTNTNIGNLHAVQAAKIMSYILSMDFWCHLGDLTFGHGTTTSEWLHSQLEEMTDWLDEAQKGIPTFMSLGNHDTGMYAVNEGTETELESVDYLFSIFGARCEGAVYGSTEYGYCYRDFDNKKLRVICLNSSERDIHDGYGANPAMSDTQLLWFAQTLYEVGSKSDAGAWSVLVLSHYPLDFATCYTASHVVKAYIDGGSIALNGTTVNFSDANKAAFIANFHGHTHCFKYARLNEVNATAKTATEYDAMRVAIPNTGFYRNNHQVEADKHGISFKDDNTWDKTIGGAKDTSFVVNVINPSDKVIHSFVYGAGIDRVISYGDIVYHRIIKNVTNVTIDNRSPSVEDGAEYIATIIPNEHCEITSVTIMMNGADITASVYNDGVIRIPNVIADVTITAKAIIALACTNQIPISTNADGSIYGVDTDGDGIPNGYKTKTYLNGSGLDSSDYTKSSTGFIPVQVGDVIRMKNMGLVKTEGNDRIVFYDENKNFIKVVQGSSSWYIDGMRGELDSDNITYTKLTLTTFSDLSGYAYIRICCGNITPESILTINEEIKYVDEVGTVYRIQYNLTNTISTINSAVVFENEPYSTRMAAKSGYTLESVVVTMGGVDITSSVYDGDTISISKVTGDIVITATSTADSVITYVNQLPISVGTDGTIFNGKGYKENTYISSGNEGTKSGSFTSGFIPCKGNDTVYFKNVGMQTGQDGHRVAWYDSNKTYLTMHKTNNTAFTGFTYGADGNIATLKVPANVTGLAFIRFCGSYIGEDSIVTVNQPIE